MTANQFHPGEISDLRGRAEEKFRAADAKPEEPQSTAELKRLVHELQVHQIELEMQNEELRRTQTELEASRTRYFDLYDLAPVGYFTLSENGAILEANVTGAGLLGVGRSDLLKQPLTHFILPDDQDIFYNHRRRLSATHSPQVCELRMIRKDAAPFWVRVEAKAPQDDENGEPIYRVVLSDITEQKRAEGVLQERSDLYRTLVENVNLGITLMDRKHRIVAVNGVHAKMIGRPVNECIGQECFRVFEKREAVCPHCPGIQAMETGKPAELEITGVWNHGVPCDIRIQAFPVLGLDGRSEGFIEVVEDITDRNMGEARLRESEARYRTLIENINLGIGLIDREHRIVAANGVLARMAGRSAGDCTGQRCFEVNEKRNSVCPYCPGTKAMATGQSAEVESKAVRDDGSTCDVRILAFPVHDSNGMSNGFIEVVEDITGRKEVEKQLAHLSAIIDSSHDAIIGKSLDGIVTSWNPGAEHLYGYTAAEMIGRPVSTLTPLDRADEIEMLLSRIRDGGRVEQYDTVRRRKDGTLVDVSLTLSPIKDNQGRIIGASAIAHEITNRKHVEDLIRESEERLANIVNNAAEGIFTMSLEGVFTFVSPAWTRSLGHDISEVKGKMLAAFVHPEDVAICQAALKIIVTTGERQDRTYRIRHKDGSWRWHHTVGSLVRDRQGQPAYFVGVAEDATERLRAEEMLRASEEKYRTYINNSPTGVFVADSNGQFVEVNAAACRLLGYSEAELTRMKIPDIVAVEDMQSAMAMHHELTQVSSTVRGEFCFIRKDGSRFFMSVDAVRVEKDRLVGFCIDITQRLNAERSLQQQSDTLRQSNQRLEEACGKAEAASRSKSEFLANMSHELRTPMTAILGFSDILAENCVKAESLEAAQIIKRNGEHLLNVINDILDLSKIEAGRATVDCQKCSPGQIAAEVLTLMKVRADAKGLPLTLEVCDDAPEIVTTDPIRLRQILVNLIGNAIKFTEMGSVRVVLRSVPASNNEGRLVFDVTDTGIGMSEEQIGLLFRPFSQVDGSASRRFGGTGLGLAISKRMAEMLGGDIVVRSVPDQGSTFSLSIAIGQRGGLIATPEANKTLAASKPLPQKLACRILLAEDGPDNQRLIAFLLRKAGAEVELAENGQIAIDLALAAMQAGNQFDVILMDMQMPVMDGYEATQNLRSAGCTEPIIALTAHAMSGDRQKCIDAGCDGYITKPIDAKKLVGEIETMVAAAMAQEPSPV